MLIIDYLQASPTGFVVAGVMLGLIVGSFLNVVIHRLPVIMERDWRAQCTEFLDLPAHAPADEAPFNLIVPRSRCPSCGHGITALENVPVISYIALRGRCSQCATAIGLRYPLVEVLSGILTGVVAWHFGFGPQSACAWLLTWSLIALSGIDLDHQLIPDAITLPFLWIGLGISLVPIFVDTHASLIGAMAGYGILWCIYQAFRLLTGKRGMGYGDFKLLAMLGAWLGWQSLPVVVLLSSLIGAVVGVSLILVRGQDRNIPIPFGPYLAAAGFVAMLWGQDIVAWYLS